MEIAKLCVKGWQPVREPAQELVSKVLNLSINGKYASRLAILTNEGVRRSNPNIKQLVIPKGMLIDYGDVGNTSKTVLNKIV